jgi:4'-phosphopantetheinyl transferase
LGKVQIYYLPLNDAAVPSDLAELACFGALSAEEVRKAKEFRNLQVQQQYCVSRRLMREALSTYVNGQVAPTKWRFRIDPNGKPWVANPEWSESVFFNLTHTRGLVACAVTSHQNIGLDAECDTDRVRDFSLLTSCLCEEEVVEIQSRLPAERPRLFLEFWTLKEGLAKALGQGLTMNFKNFRFVKEGHTNPILQPQDTQFEVERWSFRLLRPTAPHIVALAVDSHGDDLTVEEFWLKSG